MSTIYFEEIASDDKGPDTHHNGEEVESLGVIGGSATEGSGANLPPCELPVHTLTSDMVAAHKAAEAAAAAAGTDEARAMAPTADPEAAEVLKKRGNEAFGAQRFEEAVTFYSDAIECDASNGLLYGNRCAAYLAVGGRAKVALADAQQMVRLLPDAPKAHFRLGSALSACDRVADAARALIEAVRLDPSSEMIAGALRKEMGRPALKKGSQHSALVQACQQALAARAGGHAASRGEAKPRLQWRPVASTSSAATSPPKRGGAAMCGSEGRIWLIGGADRTGTVHGDVWEFMPSELPDASDGSSGEGPARPSGWRRHEAGDGFSARSGHAAVGLPGAQAGDGGTIAVFGGQDPRGSLLLNDVCLLRTPPLAVAATEDAKWAVGSPEPVGDPPEARNGHSLSVDPATCALILFGGANGEGHLNDVHRLTLPAGSLADSGGEVARWEAPRCSGPPPAAREMHVAAVLPRPHVLIVHGGRSGDEILADVCLLDLKSWAWSPPVSSALQRVGHAATLLVPSAGDGVGRLICFGGFSGDNFANDTWEIRARPDEPCVRVGAEDAPRRRFAHCIATLGDSLFVFGGSAADGELDELSEAANAAASLPTARE
jgi:hypothetical protein